MKFEGNDLLGTVPHLKDSSGASTGLKTLIVSDRLKVEYPIHETKIVCWDERPSVEAFPLVVLDLYFGDPTGDGFVRIGTDQPRFYELGAEVARCLKAGGVVIACMGPVAITPKKLVGSEYRTNAYIKKRERLEAEQLPQPDYESSYDWLDQGLLSDLRLGHQFGKPSIGIKWNLPNDRFYHMREAFKRFFESFSGVAVYMSGIATITYRVEEGHRWDTIQTVCQPHPQILGVAEHTKLPVAISFDYNYFGGQLVLLPPFQAPATSTAGLLITDLKELGEWIHSTSSRKSEERPGWAIDYLASAASALQEEISKLEQRKSELARQAEPYYKMLALLHATGSELEDAIALLFDSPIEGISVTRTDRSAFLDLFIKDSSGRTLAVEVTGVKGPLRHSDPHWADFLHYMPENNTRNEGGLVERIVLVVNTFRDSPPAERNHSGDMTGPVKKTATDNGICVLRSVDLYFLWLKTLEGMTVQNIFDTLFATEGIYEPDGSPGS